jgi:DNA-binding NtrC family response regulator
MRQLQREPGDLPDGTGVAPTAEPTVRRHCEKPCVLVVDDEHMVRIMVQLGLEQYGFDVILARNGREAIELYGRHMEEIAVVLLDVRMPGLDGPQTLKLMRELNPEVLACFMCGDTVADKLGELFQRGAAKVIAKPFRLDELARVLRLMAYGVSAEPLTPGRDSQS